MTAAATLVVRAQVACLCAVLSGAMQAGSMNALPAVGNNCY